ncbi:MAG TPA: ribosome small subunit-dependent GTPase A [Rhizomicrobium sp.]
MLKCYGWSDALQHQFESHAGSGLVPARVLVQQRGLYEIVTESGELSATLAGKFAHDAEDGGYPVTGDWVAVAPRPHEGTATIRHVLPRSSVFTRRAAGPGMPRGQVVAANADIALLAASLNADLSLRRIERYLATAWESGAEPVIVLTKADLCDDVEALKAQVEGVAFGVPVHAISAVTGDGVDAVRAHLTQGKTAVVLGSSGVGKSTLANALAGQELMTTRAIIEEGARGRHTTTHRELLLLPGGALILDTPGMRELGLWDSEEGVSAAFGEIEELATQCRFHDCRHRSEPDCAVQAALAEGTIDEARWNAYRKLQRELAFHHRKDNFQAHLENRKVWIQRNKNYRAQKKFRGRED